MDILLAKEYGGGLTKECVMDRKSNFPSNRILNSIPISMPGRLKFNWAAFFVPPIWLFGHRFWLWTLFYVVTMVISVRTIIEFHLLINLFQFGIGIYLGVKGNSMLWKTGRYRSIEELYRREKPWATFAVISLLVVLGLMFVVLLQY